MNKKHINLAVISNHTYSLMNTFHDCLESMKSILIKLDFNVYITENAFVEDAINIVWGIGTHHSKDYKSIKEYANRYITAFVNLEQLTSDSILVDKEYLSLITSYPLIDYSPINIDFINEKSTIHHPRLEFPFAPIPINYSYTPSEFLYDFAFVGAMNHRRIELLTRLSQNGFKLKIISNKYKDELQNSLQDCKALLNIHYYESSIFEIARCLKPIGMGIPIFSEISNMPSSIDWKEAGMDFFEPNDDFDSFIKFLDIENLESLNKRNIEFSKMEMRESNLKNILNFTDSI